MVNNGPNMRLCMILFGLVNKFIDRLTFARTVFHPIFLPKLATMPIKLIDIITNNHVNNPISIHPIKKLIIVILLY